MLLFIIIIILYFPINIIIYCATQNKIQRRQELLLAVFGVLGTNLWSVCFNHLTIFCNCGFNFFGCSFIRGTLGSTMLRLNLKH